MELSSRRVWHEKIAVNGEEAFSSGVWATRSSYGRHGLLIDYGSARPGPVSRFAEKSYVAVDWHLRYSFDN